MILRRTFLTALPGLFVLGGTACKAVRGLNGAEARAWPGPPPRLLNHGDNGQAVVVEGRALLLELTSETPLAELNGSWPVYIEPEQAGQQRLIESQLLSFYTSADRRVWRTFVTAPLDVVPVNYPLNLAARSEAGPVGKWSFPYEARAGAYRSSSLTLDKEFSEPPPALQQRRDAEFAGMVAIYQARTPRQWREPFILPTDLGDSDNFGHRRVVNQTKRYRHAGLDLQAPIGTPVRATNAGTVVLSKAQWVAGETICIDHGGGVFSKYAHLSERRVNVGARVPRGEIIGLSGNTGGQKPAPHLHWSINVNRVQVDPKDFMRVAAQLLAAET